MNITLEQQEHYIDTCIRRYDEGKLNIEQAINRIDNMGRMVPALRDYANAAIDGLNGYEQSSVNGYGGLTVWLTSNNWMNLLKM